MDDMFSQLMGSKPYGGMYPGSDPYAKAQMVKDKIPTADQEALQAPAIDPIMASVMGGAGAVENPGMVVSPSGVEKDSQYVLHGLFGYLLRQAMSRLFDKVGNVPTKDATPSVGK